MDNGEKFERRDFLLGVSGDTAFLWKTMFFYWVGLLGCGLSIFSVLILIAQCPITSSVFGLIWSLEAGLAHVKVNTVSEHGLNELPLGLPFTSDQGYQISV